MVPRVFNTHLCDCEWAFTFCRISPTSEKMRSEIAAWSRQSITVSEESGLWRARFDEAPLLSTGPAPYHHGFEHLLHFHHSLLHLHQAGQLSAAPDVRRGRGGGPQQRLWPQQGPGEEKYRVGFLPARRHQVHPQRRMWSRHYMQGDQCKRGWIITQSPLTFTDELEATHRDVQLWKI